MFLFPYLVSVEVALLLLFLLLLLLLLLAKGEVLDNHFHCSFSSNGTMEYVNKQMYLRPYKKGFYLFIYLFSVVWQPCDLGVVGRPVAERRVRLLHGVQGGGELPLGLGH